MRDMLTTDDEDDDEEEDAYGNRMGAAHSSPAPASYRTPQLSSADFPAVSSSSRSKITDDSALPASASWAKIGTNSSPSTPVMAVSDAFGPTLSAAVAASQQKTQFPPMPKRKSEKKKRKEQLQQQRATPEPSSDYLISPTFSRTEEYEQESPSIEQSEVVHPQQEEQEPQQQAQEEETETEPSLFDQGLTGFVLGQAYRDLCPLPSEEEFESKQKQDDYAEEQLTLGVSALLLQDDQLKCEPSPAQRHLEAIQSAASSLLPTNVPSVLDFLTYSTPTPKYTGLFNPFSHLATLGAGQMGNSNNVLNSNLDSPIRRHSRFGFAQA